MPEWIHVYIGDFILGEFKWTLIGSLLTLWALMFSKFIGIISKRLWLQVLSGIVLVALFVWYGHEMIDPYFHKMALFWITPLAEPMILIYR